MKVTHAEVFNWENVVRAMRHPLESYQRIDSEYQVVDGKTLFVLGPKDLDLMKRLIASGKDHRKFLRQIPVSLEITAPDYWWVEFDTYKVGTVANSTSTMHKIMSKEFSPELFTIDEPEYLEPIIKQLNDLREKYLATKEKKYWRALIQILPRGYNYTRTVTLNYEVLLNMYFARRQHKLIEWRNFLAEVMQLPYFAEFTQAAEKRKK